jgi:hypothetical protein
MSEQELKRHLIGSVARGKTKKGEIVAHLFSTDTRLEFPVLVLFDLSMLEQVGIDPNALTDEPVYRRFWGYYTESEKQTSKGNPYLDVKYLEPIGDAGSPGDLGEVMAELRAQTTELRLIRALLEAILATAPTPRAVPEPPAVEPAPEAETVAPSDLDAHFGPRPETPRPAAKPARKVKAASGPSQTAVPEPALAPANGDLPVTSTALLDFLQAENGGKYTSLGHLLYGIRKASGDQGWGWPISTDAAGWTEALRLAREYAERL